MDNTEVWKDIVFGKGKYQISNKGRVKTLERTVNCGDKIKMHIPESIMKVRIKSGYVCVGLMVDGKYKQCTIHRLVATHFKENPLNLPCVNHIDGNKENNNDDNVEWCSYSDNQIHAYRLGLRNPLKSYKVTDSQKSQIRDIYLSSNRLMREIASDFGISKATVSRIVNTLQ